MASVDDEADLYADLYGGEETEEQVPEPKPEAAPEPVKESRVEHAELPGLTTTVSTTAATLPAPLAAVPPVKPLTPPTVQHLDTKPIMTYSSESEQPKPRFNGMQGAFPPGSEYKGYGGQDSGYRNEQRPGPFHSVRPSEMPDEGKMFVGGLNWDTTDESLRRYFEQFGTVDACTIMRDAGGRSRGFAFLTFKDPAAVNAVMVREHYLDGKIIDPKRAIPRLEHQKTQKLFVGGLAASVTSESMRDFFSQFGTVIDATVMVDRESNRSKGFGFVTFEDGQGAEKLVGQGILAIDGKPIEVKLAQPRGAIRKDDNDGYEGGGGRGGYGGRGRFNNDSGGGGRGGGNVGMGGGAAQTATGTSFTPFDPQAMAQLWQKMQWQMQQQTMGMGGMGMGMGGMPGMGAMPGMGMGGMGMGTGGMPMMGNPMQNRMGMGNGMATGLGMPGQMGAGMGVGVGRGAPGPGVAAGVGMGAPAGIQGASQTPPAAPQASLSPTAPAGPSGVDPRIKPATGPAALANNPNIPKGPAAMRAGPAAAQGGGVGPMRTGGRGQHNYHPYSRAQ